MAFLLYTIHIIVCIFLILVVLLQQGKGADLSVFGGGATMTAFGSRGAATILHKLTVWGFIGFIFTTLAIGVLQGRSGQSTVMSDVPAVEEAAPAETPTGVPATTTVVDDEAATAAEGEVATPADDGAATVEGEDAAGSPAAVEDDSTASSGEAGES